MIMIIGSITSDYYSAIGFPFRLGILEAPPQEPDSRPSEVICNSLPH